MTIENSKVIDLNVKKEDRVLDFSDFQKQEIKFDIVLKVGIKYYYLNYYQFHIFFQVYQI